jgi:hypothetical protein
VPGISSVTAKNLQAMKKNNHIVATRTDGVAEGDLAVVADRPEGEGEVVGKVNPDNIARKIHSKRKMMTRMSQNARKMPTRRKTLMTNHFNHSA